MPKESVKGQDMIARKKFSSSVKKSSVRCKSCSVSGGELHWTCKRLRDHLSIYFSFMEKNSGQSYYITSILIIIVNITIKASSFKDFD